MIFLFPLLAFLAGIIALGGAVISGGRIIEGTYGAPYLSAGAPSAGTSEVQTLTIGGTPTGGTFQMGFEGRNTGDITWSATNATLLSNMNTALDAAFGASSIVATAGTLTAGIGTVTLTFGANYARRAVPTMTIAQNALTGTSPTLAVAETTPGVDATYRGAGVGSVLLDTTNALHYVNTGTSLQPTWTKTGTQT
jgi:hypothetical protein